MAWLRTTAGCSAPPVPFRLEANRVDEAVNDRLANYRRDDRE